MRPLQALPLRSLCAAVAVMALSACSTPVDHVHTLLPTAATTSEQRAEEPQAPRWLALQVIVPEALDRETWLLRGPGQQIEVHEHQRWPQPLSAELAQALARRLDAQLAAEGWSVVPADEMPGAKRRLVVRWLAFDAWMHPTPGVHDTWLWAIECPRRRAGSPALLASGRDDYLTAGSSPSAPDAFDRVAEEHAQALQQATLAIAAAWRAQHAGDDQRCSE
ncbi:MAG TPA: ABC-type transport auxiliary lipoprotein family protein [Methylibium sp.]